MDKELLRIADRAKTIKPGDYVLPNAVFAVLLQHHFQKGELKLYLQTQDNDGNYPNQGGYDLVYIGLRDPYDIEQYPNEPPCCIPATLVEPCALIAVMKRAEFIPYEEHNREWKQGCEHELPTLWERFYAQVSRETAVRAVTEILVPYAQYPLPTHEELLDTGAAGNRVREALQVIRDYADSGSEILKTLAQDPEAEQACGSNFYLTNGVAKTYAERLAAFAAAYEFIVRIEAYGYAGTHAAQIRELIAGAGRGES